MEFEPNTATNLPQDKVNSENSSGREKLPPDLSATGADSAIAAVLARRDRLQSRVEKQIQHVRSVMEAGSADMVKYEVANMDKLFFDLSDINQRHEDLLPPESKAEALAWIRSVEDAHFETKALVCDWLKSHEEEDARSRRSRSSRSSRSSASSYRSWRSHRSSKSNASAHSVENLASLAGYKAQKQSLAQSFGARVDAEIATLREKRHREYEAKMMDLQHRIKISEAKQAVYDSQLLQDQAPVKLEHGKGYREDDTRSQLPGRMNPLASNFVPVPPNFIPTPSKNRLEDWLEFGHKNSESSRGTPKDAEKDQADVLVNTVESMLRIQNLPAVQLDVFGGNPMDYAYFRAAFTETIKGVPVDERSKLTRLVQYTSGEAKELIKGFVHDGTNGYMKAMALLDKEYGDPRVICSAYMKELRLWPQIKPNDHVSAKAFYRFLLKCKAIKEQGWLASFESPDTLRLVVSKFTPRIQEAWNAKAVRIMTKGNSEAQFEDLVSFVNFQCKLMTNPDYSKEAFNEGKERKPTSVKTFVAGISKSSAKAVSCLECGEDHKFDECAILAERSIDERLNFVKEHHLCFSCLKPTSKTHYSKICKEPVSCMQCGNAHPSLLHDDDPTVCNATVRKTKAKSVSLCVVPVLLHHVSEPERKIPVYAMLDDCSQGTFISESVLRLLPGKIDRKANLTVQTLNGVEHSTVRAVDGLVVRRKANSNLEGGDIVRLPTAYSQDGLPFGAEEIPCPDQIAGWNHLKELKSELPEFDPDIPMGLLIGANCPRALEPLQAINSVDGGPYAYLSRLGWCVVGPMAESKSKGRVKCNLIKSATQPEELSTMSWKETTIEDHLKEMYLREFSENLSDAKGLSVDDRHFLEIMKSEIRFHDGHYTLPLPFKEAEVNLPSNREHAVQRCRSVRRKMDKNKDYSQAYTAFMEGLIEKGHAVEVSGTEPIEPAWYMPHHGVLHPLKGKLRVVFDCAATFQSRSLNKELLTGPDLTNSLLGVLLRFTGCLQDFHN